MISSKIAHTKNNKNNASNINPIIGPILEHYEWHWYLQKNNVRYVLFICNVFTSQLVLIDLRCRFSFLFIFAPIGVDTRVSHIGQVTPTTPHVDPNCQLPAEFL